MRITLTADSYCQRRIGLSVDNKRLTQEEMVAAGLRGPDDLFCRLSPRGYHTSYSMHENQQHWASGDILDKYELKSNTPEAIKSLWANNTNI